MMASASLTNEPTMRRIVAAARSGQFPAVDDRIIAASIIAVACLVALVWVFSVPPLQQPDESAHADYAFAIRDARGLLLQRSGGRGDDVTSEVRAIESATNFRSMRYTPFGKVPPGYGKPDYFKRLDGAAAPGSWQRGNDAVPYVALGYPFGYYALAAAAGALGSLVSSGSLTASFFAMRILGVVLMGIALSAIYGTLRIRRRPKLEALLLLGAVALLPLTCWVSAYIQPDTLSFAAFAVGLYLVARADACNLSVGVLAALGLDLGVLALTKQHYAACLAIPLGAWYLVRCFRFTSTIKRWYGAALLFAPIAVCWLFGDAIIRANGTAISVSATLAGMGASARGSLLHAFLLADLAVRDIFVDGSAFKTFWGAFSWVDYPVRFGTDAATAAVRITLAIATIVTIAAVIASHVAILARVRRIWNLRSRSVALTLVTRDVGGLAYVAFTIALIALYVRSDGLFGLQGRYWLPLILPTFLFPVAYGTAMIKPASRRKARLIVAGAIALYSAIAAPFAVASVHARYYDHSEVGPSATWLATFHAVGSDAGTYTPAVTTIRRGDSIMIVGYALDYRTGLPGAAVDINVDNRYLTTAHYGEPRDNVATTLHDDATRLSGFSGRLETKHLAPGLHSIRIVLHPKDPNMTPLRSLAQISVRVLDGPAGRGN